MNRQIECTDAGKLSKPAVELCALRAETVAARVSNCYQSFSCAANVPECGETKEIW